MFETLRRLYAAKRLTVAQINAAVLRGWISEDQAAEILGDG